MDNNTAWNLKQTVVLELTFIVSMQNVSDKKIVLQTIANIKLYKNYQTLWLILQTTKIHDNFLLATIDIIYKFH